MAIIVAVSVVFVSLLNPLSISAGSDDELSILNWHDYSPPPPPPPPALPFDSSSCSCEDDLGGHGDFDTLCVVNASVNLRSDVYIEGRGSLLVVDGVSLSCPDSGCFIAVNLSLGSISVGNGSKIVAGSVYLIAKYASFGKDSVLSTTALGGEPPPETSGRPTGNRGDGGGHGGRGASCFVKEGQAPEDSWGGDTYSWEELEKPDSHGSRGGSTSEEVHYGGGGGGRIWLHVEDSIDLNGEISADGGDGGSNGGGGSGGSIYIGASRM